MTTILAIIKTVFPAVLVTSFVSGLVAVWRYATTGEGIIIGVAVMGLFAAAVTAALVWPGRDHEHGDDRHGDDHEAYLQPLRVAGPAEKTLLTDLRQRRMLLRPHGLPERRAAELARKVVSRTIRERLARTPGRHAAPGKPLGIAGSAAAAARHPVHGTRPLPAPVMAVAGGGLELAPEPSLPPLPPAVGEASPDLHDATVPIALAELDAAPDAGPAFETWETGQFAAVCGVTLDPPDSDAA